MSREGFGSHVERRANSVREVLKECWIAAAAGRPNVVLVNLLIAMFSETYSRIKKTVSTPPAQKPCGRRAFSPPCLVACLPLILFSPVAPAAWTAGGRGPGCAGDGSGPVTAKGGKWAPRSVGAGCPLTQWLQ